MLKFLGDLVQKNIGEIELGNFDIWDMGFQNFRFAKMVGYCSQAPTNKAGFTGINLLKNYSGCLLRQLGQIKQLGFHRKPAKNCQKMCHPFNFQ